MSLHATGYCCFDILFNVKRVLTFHMIASTQIAFKICSLKMTLIKPAIQFILQKVRPLMADQQGDHTQLTGTHRALYLR